MSQTVKEQPKTNHSTKDLIGKWNTQTIVAIAIGAALFGVLLVYAGIPIYTNTRLSLAHLIPVIVGALFGPIPAALSGFFGNVFADLISGSGYWFDWSIGNGVAGFFIGLLPFYGAKITDGIFKVKHAIIFAIVSVIGQAVSFGVIVPIFTLLFFGGELTITFAQAWNAVIANSVVLIVVGIPLLFALANRYKKQSNLIEE